MNISKINIWVLGLCLFFDGGVLSYLESYKNNEAIDTISYLLVFAGCICLFTKAVKGTIVDAPKIAFKTDKAGFFKQRIISFFAYLIIVGIIFGSVMWLNNMGRIRKANILQSQPTDTTVAVVKYIDARQHRHGTSYYAVFNYTVNGKAISHPWYERQESDFLAGDSYEIKYSVMHPDMFMILYKLP